MTVPTEASAEASTPDGAAAVLTPAALAPTAKPAPRPSVSPARSRRAPAELPFTFADAALAAALGEERGEPAWLLEDRLEALAAFEALPVEGTGCTRRTWTCAPPRSRAPRRTPPRPP